MYRRIVSISYDCDAPGPTNVTNNENIKLCWRRYVFRFQPFICFYKSKKAWIVERLAGWNHLGICPERNRPSKRLLYVRDWLISRYYLWLLLLQTYFMHYLTQLCKASVSFGCVSVILLVVILWHQFVCDIELRWYTATSIHFRSPVLDCNFPYPVHVMPPTQLVFGEYSFTVTGLRVLNSLPNNTVFVLWTTFPYLNNNLWQL